MNIGAGVLGDFIPVSFAIPSQLTGEGTFESKTLMTSLASSTLLPNLAMSVWSQER